MTFASVALTKLIYLCLQRVSFSIIIIFISSIIIKRYIVYNDGSEGQASAAAVLPAAASGMYMTVAWLSCYCDVQISFSGSFLINSLVAGHA